MRSSWAGQRAVQPPPTFRPPSAFAMVSAAGIGSLFFGPLVDRGDSVRVKTGRLEGFDVGKAIDDAATDFQITRPPALPPPLFESARRNQPAFCQALLIDMLHCSSSTTRAGAPGRAKSRGRTWTFWID